MRWHKSREAGSELDSLQPKGVDLPYCRLASMRMEKKEEIPAKSLAVNSKDA